MSKDMSMFKKMKEKITDEVNSASNKLQSMQIMDQLTSSVGQQMVRTNEVEPNQLLPIPNETTHFIDLSSSSTSDNVNKFSLMQDSSPIGGYNEEEELNSEISPQHQLFNQRSIGKPNRPNHDITQGNNEALSSQTPDNTFDTKALSVITNINELSSDIEDPQDEDLDVEIDLLSDKPIDTYDNESKVKSSSHLTRYKNRYKTLVHTIKKMNQDFIYDKTLLEAQRNQLTNQITALKIELEGKQQQQVGLNQRDSPSKSTSSSNEKDDKSSIGSPQPTSKAGQKLKDLEKLLSKCKESLKQKNQQIQELKDSIAKIDKFKDTIMELRKEIADLREAHETWTVSIAENKRVMHQEIENKNLEMDKARREASDLQAKLYDSNSKIRNLKSAIQDLESRLVNTSAAHLKERESLIKELTVSKNAAIRQLQQEHEHNLEKVKLELEKSIEALKLEFLNKDQQIVNIAQQQQQAEEREKSALKELEASIKRIEDLTKELEKTKLNHEECQKKCKDFEDRLRSFESSQTDFEKLEEGNKQLAIQIDELTQKLSTARADNDSLKLKLEKIETSDTEIEKLSTMTHELNTRIEDLEKQLSSANADKTELEEQVRLSKTDNQELERLNRELETQVKRLSAEVSSAKDCNIKIQEELVKSEKLLNENERLRNVNELNTSQIDNLNKQLASAFSDKSALEDRLKNVEKSLMEQKKLHHTNEELIMQVDKLKEQFSSALVNNNNLEEQLKNYDNLQVEIEGLQHLKVDYESLKEERNTLIDRIARLEEQMNSNAHEQPDQPEHSFNNSTEFEYLKNIVYQFMLGKQPLVLARVISAVLKFDKNQIDQICKVQETVQAALGQGT